MQASDIYIFNHDLLRKRKERCAPSFSEYDFLFKNIEHKLTDRLYDIRKNFERVLVIGNTVSFSSDKIQKIETIDIFSLENEALPFDENSFDVVLSNLCFHWINDLPGFLVQIKKILKPDGLFLASLFGGETLFELRTSLMNTEIELCGGASPRVSPFIDIKDAGGLLQRAGFNLPVTDREKFSVTYTSPLSLINDLRGMGETNALFNQNKKTLPKKFFPTLCLNYEKSFATEDNRIKASFDILFLSAWKYHDNQQKPLKPGEGKIHLGDALKV